MTPEQVARFFTRKNGDYVFARWGRPVAPVVFGVEEQTLTTIKGAIEAMCALSNLKMVETDPEFGANFMWFFFRDWKELPEVPHLDRLVPDMGPLVAQLDAKDANQYRIFRFDEAGGIKACFTFIRMDNHLAAVPAETLALNQTVQAMLLWSDLAFADQSPLAVAEDVTVLRPEIAQIIRAAYDPTMPPVANDKSHALRLVARLGQSLL